MYISSESLMEEELFSQKLTIIGGGHIRLEFVSMYAGFGSDVTMLIHGSDFIPGEDEDIAWQIKKSLKDKGVKRLMSSDKKMGGSTVVYERGGEEFSIRGDRGSHCNGKVSQHQGVGSGKSRDSGDEPPTDKGG